MISDIVDLRALAEYKRIISFADGENRHFSMLSYPELTACRPLKALEKFMSARVKNGTVVCSDVIDASPGTLHIAKQPLDI